MNLASSIATDMRPKVRVDENHSRHAAPALAIADQASCLRHTAATRLMQRGVDPWVAGYLGMTVETLIQNYGHHHPDYLEAAREVRPSFTGTDSGPIGRVKAGTNAFQRN